MYYGLLKSNKLNFNFKGKYSYCFLIPWIIIKIVEILIGFIMMISIMFNISIYMVDYIICEIIQISGSIVLCLIIIYMSNLFYLLANLFNLNLFSFHFSVICLYFIVIVFKYMSKLRNDSSNRLKLFHSPYLYAIKSQNQMPMRSTQTQNFIP